LPDKVTPGVVFTSKYVFSEKKYAEYINYIDRSEAVRNDAYPLYSVYADYMDDPKKQHQFDSWSDHTSSLFTATKDQLTIEEKKELKKQFQKAQRNDSPMWQQVISFTDEFLEKNGLFDRETETLDEDKIREVTRRAMQEVLKSENMDGSAIWSAAIHYNTDNIHVHIAIVEPVPTRKRKEFTMTDEHGNKIKMEQFKGNMKPQTFAKAKSKIVNNIVDRSPELTKINDIIRNRIVAEKRNRNSYRDEQLRGLFLNIYRRLPVPEDKQLWKYKMNALSYIRPEIDNFTRTYIAMYHRSDFEELKKELANQEEFLKSVYGTGKQELYKNYAKTKIDDLYTRMGNALLRELREFDKTIQPKEKNTDKEKVIPSRSSSVIYNLKKALKKEYGHIKNQVAYLELQREIEHEQETVDRA
jgi:hypothetical protein